ncbi:spidroin-1-like [Gopherus flavomarginatus]|uniref:spidroin-1-like n=1 Tax=Gopherus flavomarginatus TaxID=286002 RepID=UPI0021CC0786|nr:spidroin-1-like [Gopherus flavomarginatus]
MRSSGSGLAGHSGAGCCRTRGQGALALAPLGTQGPGAAGHGGRELWLWPRPRWALRGCVLQDAGAGSSGPAGHSGAQVLQDMGAGSSGPAGHSGAQVLQDEGMRSSGPGPAGHSGARCCRTQGWGALAPLGTQGPGAEGHGVGELWLRWALRGRVLQDTGAGSSGSGPAGHSGAGCCRTRGQGALAPLGTQGPGAAGHGGGELRLWPCWALRGRVLQDTGAGSSGSGPAGHSGAGCCRTQGQGALAHAPLGTQGLGAAGHGLALGPLGQGLSLEQWSPTFMWPVAHSCFQKSVAGANNFSRVIVYLSIK